MKNNMKYLKQYESFQNKINIINQIKEYSAKLVWEIDDSKYYGLIYWSGEQKEDATEWLDYQLEDMSITDLQDLLKKLESVD